MYVRNKILRLTVGIQNIYKRDHTCTSSSPITRAIEYSQTHKFFVRIAKMSYIYCNEF